MYSIELISLSSIDLTYLKIGTYIFLRVGKYADIALSIVV